jgi:ABC-type transport system involved in multi-copper enzyme maturation permease subunit
MRTAAAFGSIARTGFREALRNRVTTVVLLFAVVLVLSAVLVTETVVTTFARVVTDVGLGWMSLTLTLLAIFLSSGLIGKEIERRTIFLIVSKPVSRSTFLLGRYAGTLMTLTLLQLGMTGLFFLELVGLKCAITPAHWAALAGMWLELSVLTAVGFFFSSFTGTVVSALCTTGVFFLGHLAPDLYRIASRSTSTGLKHLGEGLYYVLPNLERMNFRLMAAHDLAPDRGTMGATTLYALAYAAFLLAGACIFFRQRDFK